MDFHPVEFNLRESFRVLAEGRRSGDVLELPGLSIASLGAKFQMFNAAFLNAPVANAAELDERLRQASSAFPVARDALVLLDSATTGWGRPRGGS